MRFSLLLSLVASAILLSACGLNSSDPTNVDSQIMIITEGDGTETGNAGDFYALASVTLLFNESPILVPEILFGEGDKFNCEFSFESPFEEYPEELSVGVEYVLPTGAAYIPDEDPWTFTFEEFQTYSSSFAELRCAISLYWNGEIFDTKLSAPVLIRKQNAGRPPIGGGGVADEPKSEVPK